MRRAVLASLLLSTLSLRADVQVERVRIDAMVVDRVVEMSKRNVPTDVLRRIVTEDLEMLRGRRADGGYDYAYYDRYEAKRESQSFSIQPSKKSEEFEESQVSGSYVFRLVLEVPSRRLLVTKNRKLWIDHVDLEFIPQGTSERKKESVEIKSWLEPGASRTIELPVIPRQITARVFARADKDAGYGNLTVSLVEARIIDDIKSPYAAATTSAKMLLRLIDSGDAGPIRNGAAALRDLLPAAPVAPPVAIIARGADAPNASDLHREVQQIEDLMTGTDAERREALERLHQLERRLRP
jgi:hypothetical protein